MIDAARLLAAYARVRDDLLAERTPAGHWVGELSTSALSTATAVSALATHKAATTDRSAPADACITSLIAGGIRWLAGHQNADGGFGDTDKSHSNIATTLLVVAAIRLAGEAEKHAALLSHAEGYIDVQGRFDGLRNRYGVDKTFVVPIMTNCALAGLCEWKDIAPLPFELACVPQSWYRFVGMPVVSYAIPALVAIGQAHFFHRKPWNPLTRAVRAMSVARSLKVLRNMQPESGGYLEAVPLTSFVVMSLASTGRSEHDVAKEGIKFIVDSVRPDGSWPIDTNLATWVTTLSINALAAGGEDVAELLGPKCLEWLLSCQHRQRHPFTGADPGGWGWSDLSGAVPDADDTPGALLALAAIQGTANASIQQTERVAASAQQGMRWLHRLQNRDGGWPTFCRGWGSLPFDRSGTDLTAHALRAMHALGSRWEISGAMGMGLRFLDRHQHDDGSWSPLWFGNQDHPEEDNPVYGTAKVLLAYRDLELIGSDEAQRGLLWLKQNQNPDGGWGGSYPAPGAQSSVSSAKYKAPDTRSFPKADPSLASAQHPAASPSPAPSSSIEETALAVEALLAAPNNPDFQTSIERGVTWLIEQIEAGRHCDCSPIGFYFAKLWYYEKLYPIIFTVSALGQALQTFSRPNVKRTTASPVSA